MNTTRTTSGAPRPAWSCGIPSCTNPTCGGGKEARERRRLARAQSLRTAGSWALTYLLLLAVVVGGTVLTFALLAAMDPAWR